MSGLLIISLDAVGDILFERLLDLPNFNAIADESAVWREVDSIFPTNTYPVHASVVTGKNPDQHGVLGNTEPYPCEHPKWRYEEKHIRTRTLWQAAAIKGLAVAAVMWPVTAGAKSVRYNIPEIMKRPGENQILLNLRYGSKLLQLREFSRHMRLLDGISQPALDSFTTACMCDILREKKPDLAFVHLTAFDSLCHIYGHGAPELEIAFESLDKSLSLLLDAAEEMDILAFSDHAQLDVKDHVLPNDNLGQAGIAGFFECAGGSAFYHSDGADSAAAEKAAGLASELPGFARFLAVEEMRVSGHGDLPFGFCFLPGYACHAKPSRERATHGYPVDWPDYKVFYMLRQRGREPCVSTGGSLLDIAPLAARVLGVEMFCG